MPKEEFEKLRHIPDPMMGEDDYYKSFEEAFAMATSEKDRTSSFCELDLPDSLKSVQVLDHSCFDPIEPPKNPSRRSLNKQL